MPFSDPDPPGTAWYPFSGMKESHNLRMKYAEKMVKSVERVAKKHSASAAKRAARKRRANEPTEEEDESTKLLMQAAVAAATEHDLRVYELYRNGSSPIDANFDKEAIVANKLMQSTFAAAKKAAKPRTAVAAPAPAAAASAPAVAASATTKRKRGM